MSSDNKNPRPWVDTTRNRPVIIERPIMASESVVCSGEPPKQKVLHSNVSQKGNDKHDWKHKK